MKPYIVLKPRGDDVVRRNDVRLYAASFRGYGAAGRYRKFLSIFNGASVPCEMVFEIFEARPGLTITYGSMSYKQDGKTYSRVYQSTAAMTETDSLELQVEIGSPVALDVDQVKVKVIKKPSSSVLTLEVGDKNGRYTYTRTVNEKTAQVREKTVIDGQSFPSQASRKRLLASLCDYQNVKKPLRAIKEGIGGELIIDGRVHHVVVTDGNVN